MGGKSSKFRLPTIPFFRKRNARPPPRRPPPRRPPPIKPMVAAATVPIFKYSQTDVNNSYNLYVIQRDLCNGLIRDIYNTYVANRNAIDSFETSKRNDTYQNIISTVNQKSNECQTNYDNWQSVIDMNNSASRYISDTQRLINNFKQSNMFYSLYSGIFNENNNMDDYLKIIGMSYSKDESNLNNISQEVSNINVVKSLFIIMYFIVINIAAIFIYYSKTMSNISKVWLTIFIFIYPFLVYFLQRLLHQVWNILYAKLRNASPGNQ